MNNELVHCLVGAFLLFRRFVAFVVTFCHSSVRCVGVIGIVRSFVALRRNKCKNRS